MTTLLEEAEFDYNGAAVGAGTFNAPLGSPVDAQVQVTRTALRVGEGFYGPVATLYPVTDRAVRGIVPTPVSVVPALHLPASFAVFLADHLDRPKPGLLSLDQQNDAHWPSYAVGRACLRFADGDNHWHQALTKVKATIAPHDEDRVVTVTAVCQGPSERAGAAEDKRRFFQDGARISFTHLVSRANQCVVFGSWPGDQGQLPRRPFSGPPQTTLRQLDAEQALVGGGNVFAWSSNRAVLCWTGRDRPLSLEYANYGRRSDGLIEREWAETFILDLSRRRVEQLLRVNRTAELHLLSPQGDLGYVLDFTGYTAADEGEHRRNVEELHGHFSLDASGLTMRLKVRLGEYLPDTVRHADPRPDSGEVREIELKIFWETLILCQFGFQHRREAILNGD